MSNDQTKFPDYFPIGCPPSDAISQEIYVYRYLTGEEITENDFASYYLMDKDKYKNNINAYGLSVEINLDKMKKGLKLPDIRRRFKSIAGGKTYHYTGVIKNTYRPYHYTWWLYEGIKPHEYFEICI
jgi:hypothetical protein